AATLGRRAVDYQEEWFDDPPAVIALLKRILEIAPDATWARDRLKLAYGGAERWDELFSLYDDAIDHASADADRADLLAEAAQAAKDFAADAERAIGYFERLLELRPTDLRVRSLLERLYEKQGKIQPLIDLLSTELASLSGEKAQRLRLRLASLCLRDRHDEAAAFKLTEEVLHEDPSRSEAFALLEEILGRPIPETTIPPQPATEAEERTNRASVPPEHDGEPLTGSVPPPSMSEGSPSSPPPPSAAAGPQPTKSKRKKRILSVRERAAALLKEHYIAESKTQDLARVLEVELSLATNAKDKARRHQELLTLKLDTLKDDRGAFEHASALLSLEPRVSAHRSVLGELAERLSAWDRLGETLVRTADSSSDAPLVARLLIDAAEVYRDKVQRDDRAIDLFSSVLALNPKDKALALSTAHELSTLLDRAGRFQERCGVLEKIAAIETDPGARRKALGELSEVAAVRLGNPERAIRAWHDYIEQGGFEVEALDGLISVLRGAERWVELIDALERRAEMVEADRARHDLVEIATLYNERLAAPNEAIAAWSLVRERFGPGQETFLALANLFETVGQYDELARLVLGETKNVPAGPEAPFRLVEQKVEAEIALAHIADRNLAVQVCQAVFDAGAACWTPPLSDDHTSEGAGLWAHATWWALDELIRMALEDNDYPSAVQRLLDGSRIVFDREKARRMRHQGAVVTSEHLDDPSRAVNVYRELLAEDATDAIADAVIPELARLLAQLGAFADLTDLWERQAVRHGEGDNRGLSAELWARAADLCEKQLGDIDRAITDYHQSAHAGSQGALRQLARLYRGKDEPGKAAEALERLTYQPAQDAFVTDTLALVDAYLAAGDRDRARTRLEKGVELAARPKPMRARLRELYREERDWTKLADLLRIEAEDAEDKKTRFELLREAADLHMDKRNDPAAAIPLLEQARKLEAQDSQIGLALTRALVATSRFEEATAILRSELERFGHRRPKERALVHFELSRVSLKTGERARALAELDLAAKIDPAHPAILYTLGKLSADEGQLDRAQRTFRALLLVLGRSDPGVPVEVSRGEVLFELAAIAEKEKDPERAEELIESALHAASENERDAERFEHALREKGSYDLLARSLEARLATSANADTRVAILRDLALVYDERQRLVGDVRAQLKSQVDQALREIKESPPQVTGPWAALENVYERLGEPDRQAEALVEQIALFAREPPSPAHADALYRLAQLRLAHGETLAEGASLLERALEADPQPARAARALVPALEIDPKNEHNVRLYEKVARANGGGPPLADALLRLIDLGIATPGETREA
ncbi:MAG TPA: tetratricopeptide repeat protein, partial [Polyangiaceae bacterium]